MLIWCHQREIILRARYIPGKLNALADQLSRRGQILHTEWSLCPRIFKQLCNQFTKPMWDLFATKYNKKLEIYASPMPDPESEAVDALSLSWENMWAYAYPPTALIPQILTKIQTEDCQIMLIAPAYARAQWYQTLLSLIVEAPVVLPPSKGLLKQPRSNIYHKNPKSLDLHAWILQAKGFSENTARCITKSVRGSTNAIYNSKWGIFEAWCCKRKIYPVKVSIHRIADFLTEKREGGLSATTIEGYRSAISNTLKHTSGLDLGLDSYISALLRSFRLEDTKRRNPSPPWDLSLVLAVLRSKPFEPIRSISMKNLTLKTVFLLALASGKRRSELHALSRAGVSWNKQKTRMTFRVTPSFVAKTQISTNVGAIHPFTINSLKYFVDDDKDEMALCPVRALFEYMRRSEALGLTKDKKKLFVSLFKGKTTEISKPTISNWIKETIVTCYKLANNTQVPLQEVLQAGTWRSHNTFVSFYLQDLSEENQEGYRLGPIIAGQSVVNI